MKGLDNKFEQLLVFIKKNNPAHYTILMNNNVKDIYFKLKTTKEKSAFILLIALLISKEHRQKFLKEFDTPNV